jgi:Protein of unknown function (DUF1475)
MNTRNALIVVFGTLLLTMIVLDVNALLRQGFLIAAAELWPNPWVKAAGVDAVFAFLTIYLWVLCRERTAASKVFWLCFIAATGSIATSTYVLLQLCRLSPQAQLRSLLSGEAA